MTAAGIKMMPQMAMKPMTSTSAQKISGVMSGTSTSNCQGKRGGIGIMGLPDR